MNLHVDTCNDRGIQLFDKELSEEEENLQRLEELRKKLFFKNCFLAKLSRNPLDLSIYREDECELKSQVCDSRRRHSLWNVQDAKVAAKRVTLGIIAHDP